MFRQIRDRISRAISRIFPRTTAEIVFYAGDSDRIKSVRTCYFVTASLIRAEKGEFYEEMSGDRISINRYYGYSNLFVKSVNGCEIELDFAADLTAIAEQCDRCGQCKYFHGKFYGKQYLHCGVHPYMPQDVLNCADFEAH
jgi:hypothetical protein